MAHVLPDPLAQTSLLIPNSAEISTIRLTVQNDYSDWKILQDYREKSILNGFASVGGLGTFLGGLFAIVYGSSIVRILFGGASYCALCLKEISDSA